MNTRDREYMQEGYSVDPYNEMQGFSVYESTQDFLQEQLKGNIQDSNTTKVYDILYISQCKNGNVRILGKSPNTGEIINLFVNPLTITQAFPKTLGNSIFQSVEQKTTPRGNIYNIINWDLNIKMLQTQLKGLQMLVANKILVEIF